MAYGSPGPNGSGAPPRGDSGEWRQEQVTLLDEGLKAIDSVLCVMAQRGYARELRERLRPEMEEALLGALLFTQCQDPRRPVLVAYRVGADYTLVEIEGRERGAQRSPLRGPHGEDLLRPVCEEPPFGGRFYTWLRCNRCSGRLLVCRHLSVP